MKKTIFSQGDEVQQEESLQEREFKKSSESIENSEKVDKQEFDLSRVTIEELEDEEDTITQQFDTTMNPKNTLFKRIVIVLVILFLGATVAQSVQWLIDTWRANEWIYFAFAIVSCSVVVLGIISLIKEWRRLVKLKRLSQLQQASHQLLVNGEVIDQNHDKGEELCLRIANNMGLDKETPNVQKWLKHINEGDSASEVTYLFSQDVLQDVDNKAKKMISHSSAESAVIVAVSPLAVVDMFFVAWRNLRLVNRLAALYGIELGYFSRIRLLRMVLFNIAFAGATELVREIGMDWLSQDLAAKLSARAAQGVGVGLLTARLGIKTMEFCRPVAFEQDEKPKLSIIHKELLGVVKSTLLGRNKVNTKEKVS